MHIGALDAAEFVASGNVAYARVDLDGLAEEFPEMQEGLDTFRAQLTGEDGISPPAPATVLEPITALLDGEWVSMDVQAYLDQLDELSAGTEGGGPADTGLSAETAAQLRDLLGTALKDAVVSVERREADDELGDHLVAGLDLRKAYTELASGLPDLFTGAAADGLRESLPPVTDVPDKQIDVSFWVLDDELTRVELDLAQFLDEPAGHLVLRADVRPGQEITAPSGAVEFDVAALMEAGTSADQPTEEAQPVPEVDAHMVATWVDMDFASLAYEWHTTPSVHLLPEVLPSYEGIAEGLEITAVGQRIQVTLDQETVCLTLSFYGERRGHRRRPLLSTTGAPSGPGRGPRSAPPDFPRGKSRGALGLSARKVRFSGRGGTPRAGWPSRASPRPLPPGPGSGGRPAGAVRPAGAGARARPSRQPRRRPRP